MMDPGLFATVFLTFACFSKFSRPGISLLMSKSVILLVAILYAGAIEAVKSRATLSASSYELFWISGEINSEAKR
jgi:hypothetical protein